MYDRAALRTGIVHLGIGAFHRAHQAAYTDAVLTAGDLRWGIMAASLRSSDTRDALAPQDCLYTLNQRAEADRFAVIGSVLGVLVAPEDPGGAHRSAREPGRRHSQPYRHGEGYCLDSATGQLDEAHPDIVHDPREPGRIAQPARLAHRRHRPAP